MTVVVSLGSNLGDRLAYLRTGIAVIRQRLPVEAISAVYETDPVGGDSLPAYLNAVALIGADDPEQALAAARVAEAAAGRERPYRWAPRTLDVDVVSAGTATRNRPELTVPHPRAHERAFVLVPWLEVEPDAELAGTWPGLQPARRARRRRSSLVRGPRGDQLMRPTRRRDLVMAAVVAAALAYLVTRLGYADLPSPTVYSLLWIPLLTIAEVYIAVVTRSRLAGRHGTRPINPLVVARIAALAKATSLVGALALGGYAGFFGWVVQVSSTTASRDTRTAAIGVGLSGLLVAAAAFLEHVCRVPDDPDEGPPEDPDPR